MKILQRMNVKGTHEGRPIPEMFPSYLWKLKMSHEGYRKTRSVLPGTRLECAQVEHGYISSRERRTRRAAHGIKTVNTGDVIDQASALWQSDAWWPRQRAASTRSKWRWLEAEVARAGGTRSWTAQEDGDAARRGLRRRRQPGPVLQRWNGVGTGLLTLSWAGCWPRLTPPLSQVLEQAWLTPDLERQQQPFGGQMQCFCKKPGIFRVYPGLYRVYPKNTRFFCRSRFVCSHLPG